MSKRTIVFIAIAFFVIIGFAMQVHEEKETYRDAMQDALYIEDINHIDESMLGHYVILAGTPEMKTGAYDPDFDIQFDYPVVYRNSFALYDTGSGGKHKISWDKTYRSDDYPYGSTDLVGEATIGCFTIQGDALLHIFENSSDKLVTEELAKQTGWVYCDKSELAGVWLLSKPKTYNNRRFNWQDRGMLRVSYNAKSRTGIPCTILGYLDENGTIAPTEEYDVKYLKGIMDKDEFLKKY